MIIPNSSKHHPEFDINTACSLFSKTGDDQDLEGELITSPYDLYSVEQIRDRSALRIGLPVPTDVFVFGRGEPKSRDCTKIGGLPYWPSNRPWPTGIGGKPLLFLAQFNFADSMDLVGGIPGTVLLLLVEEGDDWLWEPDRMHLEWIALGETPIEDFNIALTVAPVGPFFGAIFRSADYPEAAEKADDSDVSQSYNLAILNGTKIGGLPHFIQSGDGVEGDFICQLGSIQAAPHVPYPWVNDPEPLGLGFDSRGIYADENSMVFGDMGTIYIFRDQEGRFRSSFECY